MGKLAKRTEAGRVEVAWFGLLSKAGFSVGPPLCGRGQNATALRGFLPSPLASTLPLSLVSSRA